MSYKGRFTKQKSGGGKKIVWIVLGVVLALILAVIVTGILYWNHTLDRINDAETLESTLSQEELDQIVSDMQDEFNNENAVDSTEPTDKLVQDPEDLVDNTEKIINIMLIGQDMRKGQTWKLSDSMILCTVNLETKTLVMTSFMRDMYVKLPDYDGYKCGYNRINNCYSLGYAKNGTKGAMEMLDMCLLENFGVQVDHNIEVDFVAFEKIVDLMDGVDIELTGAEASHLNKNTGWGLKKGVNHLNGEQALAYARIRKIDSDFARTDRQRKVLNVLLDKCRSMNLAQLNELLQTVLPLVTTDMDNKQITDYALKILPIIVDLEVISQRIPADGAYKGANKGTEENPKHVLVPDLEANRQLLRDTIGG